MTSVSWTSADIEAAQDRYLSDIEAILRESVDPDRRRVVLLSGGTDSFLIVAALRHILPQDELYTVTIKGLETDDLAGANDVARHFGTNHWVCQISVDDVMENLNIIAGAGHRTLRPAMSHICFRICLERYGVKGCAIYSGQGADVLYGSRLAIYAGMDGAGQQEDHHLDRRRTELKQAFYEQFDFRTHHLIDIVGQLGGKLIMPFSDGRLSYLTRIPFSVVSPLDKRFAKDAMRRRYGLDGIVERKRTSMQEGTGLYRLLKDRLKKEYGTVSDSAVEIARWLSAPR